MLTESNSALKAASPYTAVETRQQFLFHETRTTAKLLMDGLSNNEIIDKIVQDNLFQYPTQGSIRLVAQGCLRRLECLNDDTLVAAIANQPSGVAKQICLYAMMKQYRLVWDFMITVIGEKYRTFDMTFTKMDLNAFFTSLQEQDDWVATWSDKTIEKLKSVLKKVLVENEYLENNQSEVLQPVLIDPLLESSIRASGNEQALAAFNCFT